jgi:hypothetical protein
VKSIRLIGWLVLLLIAVAAIWYYLFPSPERAIENRFKKLSKLISADVSRSNIRKAANASSIVDHFTPDAAIRTEGFSRFVESLNGRAELMQAIMAARGMPGSISAEFYNLSIQLSDDKQSATVYMTAIVRAPDQTEPIVADLKVGMKKADGKWLISTVEPSKTKMTP